VIYIYGLRNIEQNKNGLPVQLQTNRQSLRSGLVQNQNQIRIKMVWICIAYKMNKNCTMQIKYIYQICIEQFFSHI
jgi:hypothetical protein